MTRQEMLEKCAMMKRMAIIVGVMIISIMALIAYRQHPLINFKGLVVSDVLLTFIFEIIAIIAMVINAVWPKKNGIFCLKCGKGPTLLKCREFVEANKCPRCGEKIFSDRSNGDNGSHLS